MLSLGEASLREPLVSTWGPRFENHSYSASKSRIACRICSRENVTAFSSTGE